MRPPRLPIALLPLLSGCADGNWVVSTWGEDFIESSIPADAFADGCAASFSRFTVEITEAALLDGDGAVVGEVDGAAVELTAPGPHLLGSAAVPAAHHDTARFTIAPPAGEDGAASVHVAGTLVCGDDTVAFDWAFSTTTTYRCAPAGLTVPAKGEVATELTVHGDHLFYDGLEAEDAVLRGAAIVAADADGDGEVTLDELAAVGVAGLGHTVGRHSEVTDLAAFVTHLSRTLGHVDGEGHCEVVY